MPIASIDVHSHALPQAYLDALAELGVDPVAEDGFPTPVWSEEAHLRFMEETGQEFLHPLPLHAAHPPWRR